MADSSIRVEKTSSTSNRDKCHFTWPVLQEAVHQRPDRIKQVITILINELEKEPVVRRHQKQNLLGFCLFKIGDKYGAQKVFKDILEENSENFNALNNLAFVLTDLGRNRERVHEIKKKINQLLTVTNENWMGRVNARKAEQIAEEASAYGTFDQHQKSDGTLAIRLRWHALEIGTEADRFKYNEWKYGLAFDLARLDNKYITQDKVDTEQYFIDSAKLCYDIVQEEVTSDSDFKLMQAKVWVLLGDLANRRNNRSLKKFLGLNEEPDCYINALITKGDHPLVLRTIAEKKRQQKEYSEAIKLFTRSIEKEDMWWARHRRGKTYLERYEEITDPSDAQVTDLDKAIDDLKVAKEMYSMFYVFVDLAKALKCKGSAENIEEALDLCKKAIQIEGENHNIELYKLTKEILSLVGKSDVEQEIQKWSDPCGESDSKVSDWIPLDRIDCLVLHSSRDCYWQQFFPKLEKLPLKWESWSNEDTKQTIEYAIGGSKKVMVILTDDLLKSSWFRRVLECKEMKIQLEKHRILPIIPHLETPTPQELIDEFSLKGSFDSVFWNRVLEFLALPPPPSLHSDETF